MSAHAFLDQLERQRLLDAAIIEDDDATYEVLCRIFRRTYGELADEAKAVLRARATKRVVIRVTPRKTSSWDHSKTANPY